VHTQKFIKMIDEVTSALDFEKIEEVITQIEIIQKEKGRLFVMGVGGSSANASHAVNDFRKIAKIEAYCPTDNVAELTARTNDEGWNSVFMGWLEASNVKEKDGVFLLSVGGGDLERQVSMNLVYARGYGSLMGAKTFCIVGRKDSPLSLASDYSIVVPDLYPEYITPITEAIQSVILHLIVSHPSLQKAKTKW